jgi:hypothetical protein
MSHTMSSENIGSWDQAIADARALLRRVEERAIRVRCAISSFEQSKRDGEPYSTQSPNQTSEAATV